MPDPPLALLLLAASRWFDRQLLERLEARGWPRLSSAQSLVFAHLPPQGIAPASLARALGATRQSTQELLAGLGRLDLVEVVDDPGTKRGRLARLTPRGRRLAADALVILTALEDELGRARCSQVRALLTELPTPHR